MIHNVKYIRIMTQIVLDLYGPTFFYFLPAATATACFHPHCSLSAFVSLRQNGSWRHLPHLPTTSEAVLCNFHKKYFHTYVCFYCPWTDFCQHHDITTVQDTVMKLYISELKSKWDRCGQTHEY